MAQREQLHEVRFPPVSAAKISARLRPGPVVAPTARPPAANHRARRRAVRAGRPSPRRQVADRPASDGRRPSHGDDPGEGAQGPLPRSLARAAPPRPRPRSRGVSSSRAPGRRATFPATRITTRVQIASTSGSTWVERTTVRSRPIRARKGRAARAAGLGSRTVGGLVEQQHRRAMEQARSASPHPLAEAARELPDDPPPHLAQPRPARTASSIRAPPFAPREATQRRPIASGIRRPASPPANGAPSGR